MTGFSQPERRGLKRMQSRPESHPDPDLLTAFAEHALTSREHEQVLGHLAVCAECRDVVALAGSPLVEPVPEPVRKRAGWEMGLFHWGAVAATAIVVVAAVSLGIHDRRASHGIEFSARKPAAQAEVSQAQSDEKLSSAPATQQPQQLADAKAAATPNPAAPETTRHAVHLQQEVRYERPRDVIADKKTSTNAPLPAAPMELRKEAPVTASAETVVVESQANASAQDANEMKQAPAARTTGTADQFQARNQSVAVSGASVGPAASKAKVMQASPAFAAGQAQSSTQPSPQAPPQAGSTPPPEGALHVRAPHIVVGKLGADGLVTTPAEWQITKDGRLQRSVAGSPWEDVLPAKQFRSIARIGSHVWAGGDKGTLYHSADDGLTWKPVTIASGNTALTGNVTNLRFSDAQHGSLGTSTGETWITADGGQTWQKK